MKAIFIKDKKRVIGNIFVDIATGDDRTAHIILDIEGHVYEVPYGVIEDLYNINKKTKHLKYHDDDQLGEDLDEYRKIVLSGINTL